MSIDYNKYLGSNDKQIIVSDDPLPKNMHFIYVIIGKRGSGKSNLLLNALQHKIFYKGYFDNIFMLSPTAQNDKKFKKLLEELDDDDKFYNDCNDTTIQEIIDKITTFNDEWDNNKREPRNLIIFDDCIADMPKSTTKSLFNKLIISNRHLKTSIIITSQKFNLLNTTIRANIDMISFFKNDNSQEKKGFLDEYGIDEKILNAICVNNHDFMHVSFCSGVPLYYDKFNVLK